MSRFAGIAVTALLAGASTLLLLDSSAPSLLTALAAAAYVLVLPGYALSRAVFARTALSSAEHVMLTIGLSIAIAIICGLVLSVLPSGLAAPAWGLALGLITLAACCVAVVRLRSAAPNAEGSGASGAGWRASAAEIPNAQLLLLVAAGALTAGSLLVARIGVLAQPQQPFTQLWMQPAANGTAVDIGMTSHEDAALTGRLVVTIDGAALATVPVALQPGQTLTQQVSLPAQGALLRTVDAALIRDGQSGPYREVHVDVKYGSSQ